MKIYVKKEDNQPLILTIIGAIIVFLMLAPISLCIILVPFSYEDFSLILLVKNATLFILGANLFLMSLLLITSIPIYIFKKPATYKLKLKSKTIETYKGKEITYMTFTDSKNKSHGKYKCYTIGENHFIIGKDYILKIKELNWEPKYIEELTDNFDDKKNNIVKKLENIPIFLIIISIVDLIIMVPYNTIIYQVINNKMAFNFTFVQLIIINIIFAIFCYQLIKRLNYFRQR